MCLTIGGDSFVYGYLIPLLSLWKFSRYCVARQGSVRRTLTIYGSKKFRQNIDPYIF